MDVTRAARPPADGKSEVTTFSVNHAEARERLRIGPRRKGHANGGPGTDG
jgi:hypothetical protein